ncbi:MAG: sugar ABC transporter permease [Clostridia bacterium]|nr:sugar ABC transporter permease [Clostridia bacterium]
MIGTVNTRKPKSKSLLRRVWDYRVIYLMLLPTVAYFILFKCRAVAGMTLAFYDYKPRGSNVWVGLKYFQQLFSSPTFGTIILNTIKISLLRMILNWIFPVMFAIMQHQVRKGPFRKSVQVISYLPHFLSWIVIFGIWRGALEYGGLLNNIYDLFGVEYKNLLLRSDTIVGVIGLSSLWRGIGWDSIIYLAAILAIDTTQFDAATVDGASRLQVIRHIILPSLVPTMATILILNCGSILDAGVDQILAFQNSAVQNYIEVLDTYVYRVGVVQGNYSFSTAAGLFKSVVGLIFVTAARWGSGKLDSGSAV